MDKFALMKRVEKETGKPADKWGSQEHMKYITLCLQQEQGELETEDACGEVYKG